MIAKTKTKTKIKKVDLREDTKGFISNSIYLLEYPYKLDTETLRSVL
jgi:hypothetical protein